MKLKDLLGALDNAAVTGGTNAEITGISFDSRQVKPGDLFVALRGGKFDGHQFIRKAAGAGARAVVVEEDPGRMAGVEKIVVSDSRRALAMLTARFWGNPSQKLRMLGVTGTNGKTTTTYLLESVLNHAGKKTGVVGTINYRMPGKVMEVAERTTPDPNKLHEFLRGLAEGGGSHCVMEVSSHALDQERVGGIEFAGAVFTNLTQDHLDYHRTLEEYFRAKTKLFVDLPEGAYAVVNADDEYGRRLPALTRARVVTYGLERAAGVRADNLRLGLDGCRFVIDARSAKIAIETRLIGRHNVSNILAAAGAALAEGIDREDIRRGIREMTGVPGRLERIDEGQDFFVFVDYAHTPDALQRVLNTIREIEDRKIVLVFGCGGDRDRGKRPLMGKIARELADFTILTSDNPRSEDPAAILAQIQEGFGDKEDSCLVVPDRGEAIAIALEQAGPGEVVLIAGKGHEDYQIFRDRTVPFDDRAMTRKILKEKAVSPVLPAMK